MSYNVTEDLMDMYFRGNFSMHQDTQSIYFKSEPFDLDNFRELVLQNVGVLLDDECLLEVAHSYAAENTYASMEEELKTLIDWWC